MKQMLQLACLLTILVILMGCNDADRPVVSSAPPATAQQDNTAVNVRDRDGTTTTPLDQKENQSDINTTANIRKQLVATKMSVDAQNAKIITRDGKVTLRGPVKSAEEKQQLERIATDVAGVQNVDSQLEVKP
jgi:hyperosmotically inducible periplasmic protein